MCGLMVEDTPILNGYRLYHNFIRPHETLKGRTPAELAGIKVLGEDNWMTLIQNAYNPAEGNSQSEGGNPTQR